jgi:hypothetical protein
LREENKQLSLEIAQLSGKEDIEDNSCLPQSYCSSSSSCQIELTSLRNEKAILQNECINKDQQITILEIDHQTQVALLDEQNTNLQKEYQEKDQLIASLQNDQKTNVDSLQQQHDTSLTDFQEIQLKVDMRQLFNDFRHESKIGVFIDTIQLLNWVRH